MVSMNSYSFYPQKLILRLSNINHCVQSLSWNDDKYISMKKKLFAFEKTQFLCGMRFDRQTFIKGLQTIK